ncbi:hypothetical protein [Salinactinospora qingdaonensis]|uniref:Uncharacterized protein n=1 Tax=Salinactinospora qingdaonensis TaxID=702744 RepID=A0ABP7GAK8_9ACTN
MTLNDPPGALKLRSAFELFILLLRNDGSLLLDFFSGPAWQRFPHAITEGFYRDIDDARDILNTSGFRGDEVHMHSSNRHRDQGATIAAKI